MKDRENRFLEAMEITPGPWKAEKESEDNDFSEDRNFVCWNETVDDESTICDARYSMNDAKLIAQSPAMFLTLFRRLCEDISFVPRDLLRGQDKVQWEDDAKTLELAAGKTWPEIWEIWEGTE